MRKYIFVLCAVFFTLVSMAQVPMTRPGVIKDIAGVPGKRAFAGDGGDALKARLANPMGVILDRFSNIYIADTNNHRIRRIDARTGYIETIAGTGRTGFSNDGGNADMATLNAPTAMVIEEKHGFLFVADSGNNRIRLITLKTYPGMNLAENDPLRRWALPQLEGLDELEPSNSSQRSEGITVPRGYIYTVAGTGRSGYDGEGSLSTVSSLNSPTGLAISPDGELYISDTGNNRIRKIDKDTGLLITVAGTGEAGDDGDYGLAVNARLQAPTVIQFDQHGNLFILDSLNHKVRFVDHSSGRIFTIAGDGKRGYKGDNKSGRSTNARFNDPTGMALDRFGRIYVADTDNHRIRRITIDLARRTSYVETVVGTGKRGYNGDDKEAWRANLAYPSGMIITPYDTLYFVDAGNNLVRRVRGISLLRAATSYQMYGQPEEEIDSRNFYEVLFEPQMQAE